MNGVVLEGGGAKGAYQAGALKALKDNGIIINGVVGTSIGSINAAFVSAGEIDKLVDMWKKTKTSDLLGIDDKLLDKLFSKKIDASTIKDTFKLTRDIMKNSGINTDKIKKVLDTNISEEKIRKSKIDFGLVTYNVTDRKPVEIFKEDIPNGKLTEYLIASSYLPIFKSEKIINDKIYTDGGIYNNLPISMLLKRNYEKIYAIRTHGIGITKKLKKDTEEQIIYINPSKNLGSIVYFSPQKNIENIKCGYYDTLKVLKNLDGNTYYFKNKDNKYFEKLVSNIDSLEINKLLKKYKVNDIKELVINKIEEVLIDKSYENYKVYKLPLLLIKLKLSLKSSDKNYDFIKKLKIKF